MERDKLKDLLGEYIDSIGQQERWEIKTEEIISKKFGFIKRLVDNDKIDLTKLYHDMRLEFGDYYWLLMQLSISENPIELLISLLK